MTKANNGTFVISLDFELQWGIFDVISINSYRENLENTRGALKQILDLSDKNDIRLTIATVGFLFAKDREDLKPFLPPIIPSYANSKLNAYKEIEKIGSGEHKQAYYFAQDIIKNILDNTRHEICTHTFSHYYCGEKGQNNKEFEADLKSAKKIGKNVGVDVASIVFPRNQVNETYLESCRDHGITSYRGTETSFPYTACNSKGGLIQKLEIICKRALRLLDSYANICGSSTYNVNLINEVNSNSCINLPSSRFLRPYNEKLSFLESLKIKRIKKAMTYAAKNNELYHLWWHPHNFGKNMAQNLKNLELIYDHYSILQKKYGFKSETMNSLTEKITKI